MEAYRHVGRTVRTDRDGGLAAHDLKVVFGQHRRLFARHAVVVRHAAGVGLEEQADLLADRLGSRRAERTFVRDGALLDEQRRDVRVLVDEHPVVEIPVGSRFLVAPRHRRQRPNRQQECRMKSFHIRLVFGRGIKRFDGLLRVAVDHRGVVVVVLHVHDAHSRLADILRTEQPLGQCSDGTYRSTRGVGQIPRGIRLQKAARRRRATGSGRREFLRRRTCRRARTPKSYTDSASRQRTTR